MKWIEDCEAMIKSYNLLDWFPVLYYHLSLVYALKNAIEPSRRAFDTFINKYEIHSVTYQYLDVSLLI